MCRIAGFWDFNYHGEYNLESTAIAMRDSLSHGGPDDAGLYIEPNIGLALGHRRLSILDLSNLGHQPMEFENLVITYNGEIYNFLDIRKELEKEGYRFASNSDTEVLIKAFHRWGYQAVHKFRGMFAFAIWNKSDRKLILCRDRVGVKPLYYYYKDGLFMFSSELKAFHKHPKFKKQLNTTALSLYFQYGYITSPFSIFENTYKLKPGYFLIINHDGAIENIPYWKVEQHYLKNPIKLSEEEIIEELENILIDSFKLRLVSDVPVGVFLSGGIDSSTVTALLQKNSSRPLKTFTIGFFERDYNEAHHAKKIANFLGTDHTEMYCTPQEAYDIIPKLPEIYDEPFGDPSAIPTYLVSKLAKTKVKVALSADGGDEQFCGYSRYWIVKNLNTKLNRLPFITTFGKALDYISPNLAFHMYSNLKFMLPKWTNFRDKYIKLRNVIKSQNLKNQYDVSNQIFLKEEVNNLLSGEIKKVLSNWDVIDNPDITDIDDLSLMMFYDLKSYLPDDILVKVDRATMSVALEGREPFLDHKIIEFTSNLPYTFKYRNGVSKYILRKILAKHIPNDLIDRPKMGFGVPIYEWFKSELKELYKEYLGEEKVKKIGVLNPEYVKGSLNGYFENRGVNHNKLWFIFCFQLWAEKWMC